MIPWIRRLILAASAGAAGWLGLVTGAVPVDLGIGRRTRPLGPQQAGVLDVYSLSRLTSR